MVCSSRKASTLAFSSRQSSRIDVVVVVEVEVEVEVEVVSLVRLACPFRPFSWGAVLCCVVDVMLAVSCRVPMPQDLVGIRAGAACIDLEQNGGCVCVCGLCYITRCLLMAVF